MDLQQPPQPVTDFPPQNKQSYTSVIFVTAIITFVITSILVGGGTYWWLKNSSDAAVKEKAPSQAELLPSPQTESNAADPHSLSGKGITIELADKRRIPAGDPSIGALSRTDKDIVLLDFLLTAGPECEKGCSTRYIEGYNRDYHLATITGEVGEIGRAKNAALITDPDQFVVMFTGQKMKRQAYFYVNLDAHSFIFRYIGSAFTPTQPSYSFDL